MSQTAMRVDERTLRCTEGGSSKQYTLWLEQQGSGWLVNFQYGPIGGWVKDGTKTPNPVTRAEADKVYAKLLKEKQAKGYAEGQAAPAFSQTAGAVDSGLRPMLLTPDTEDSLETYLTDPRWVAQEKMNGIRLLLKSTGDKVVGVNRRGLERPIPTDLEAAVAGKTFVLDGELIGTTFHAFDALEISGTSYRAAPLTTRLKELELVVNHVGSPTVKLVATVRGEKAKRAFVAKLRAERKEGVVFKLDDSVYEPGRRETLSKALAVKIKFYAEAAVVVMGWNKAKQSVEVGLRDGLKVVSVGNVTVPTKYVGQIVVGHAIRVRYLYATPGAQQLYQPTLDATDDGSIKADHLMADEIGTLKFEGKKDE